MFGFNLALFPQKGPKPIKPYIIINMTRRLNGEKWILPTMVIRLIDNLVLKGGETQESIKDKRVFGKTREAWIAAVFLLSKIVTEKRLWYLRGNEIENSAEDIYARCIWKEGKVIHSGTVLPIQIARKTDYGKDDIVGFIKKKLTADLSGVSLVCYVMTNEIIYWRKIHNEVIKLKPKTRDITLLGNIGERKFIIGRVHPSVQTLTIDLNSVHINAPEIIEATEVIRPESTGIKKQGVALLTPVLKIE